MKILLKYEKLFSEEALDKVCKKRQVLKEPKYRKTLYDIFSKEITTITDIQQTKYKRNMELHYFKQTYSKFHKKKLISVLNLVVNIATEENMTTKVESIKRKLRRKGIEIYGYCKVRDIGEINYQPHFHIIVAISRINGELFKELFQDKKDDSYSAELCRSLGGIIKYLSDKEVYGAFKQKSYKVTIFSEPKAN